MPKTYDNIKANFLWLLSRHWLSLRALTWLKKLKMCFQISNELYDDVIDNSHSVR